MTKSFLNRCGICLLFSVVVLSAPKLVGGGDLDEEQAAADHTTETIAAARHEHAERIKEAKAEFARRQQEAREKEDARKMLHPLAMAK